jgi:hypothetical protein
MKGRADTGAIYAFDRIEIVIESVGGFCAV